MSKKVVLKIKVDLEYFAELFDEILMCGKNLIYEKVTIKKFMLLSNSRKNEGIITNTRIPL